MGWVDWLGYRIEPQSDPSLQKTNLTSLFDKYLVLLTLNNRLTATNQKSQVVIEISHFNYDLTK